MLDTEMSGQGLTGGVVNEGLHQMLSHLMIAFETTLKPYAAASGEINIL
jgi:hypothetical protein